MPLRIRNGEVHHETPGHASHPLCMQGQALASPATRTQAEVTCSRCIKILRNLRAERDGAVDNRDPWEQAHRPRSNPAHVVGRVWRGPGGRVFSTVPNPDVRDAYHAADRLHRASRSGRLGKEETRAAFRALRGTPEGVAGMHYARETFDRTPDVTSWPPSRKRNGLPEGPTPGQRVHVGTRTGRYVGPAQSRDVYWNVPAEVYVFVGPGKIPTLAETKRAYASTRAHRLDGQILRVDVRSLAEAAL